MDITGEQYRLLEANRNQQRHSNPSKATREHKRRMGTSKYNWTSADTTREHQIPLKAYRLSEIYRGH